MSRLLLLLSFLSGILLYGCNLVPLGMSFEPAATDSIYKAVYLTDGVGELSFEDLTTHPEVIVVNTFDELKSRAGSRIALWVDKNSVDLVDSDWLNQPPQKFYPLVLVGYNDPLYCFRDTISVGRIIGPHVDWDAVVLEPGFCVWMILTEDESSHKSIFRGNNLPPTVQDILDVTNPLLDEEQEIK